MKIGVITFWHGNNNYGMILQCWALQKFLKDMGHIPFIIRYIPELNLPLWRRILQKVKRSIFCKKKNPNDITRNFDKFRKEKLTFSIEGYHNINELRKNPPQADCYITGSDQVWAQLLSNQNNRAYFLDFGSKQTKRISYAPSFAMESYPEHLKDELRICLQNFDAISTREYSGVNICRDLGINAIKVLDPTLLLDKSDYKEIIYNKCIENKYIYIYSININSIDDIYWDDLKKYADRNNFSILTTPSDGYIKGEELFGQESQYSYATVEEWLGNIFYSNLVITPSFHGIALSIILEKPFIYIPLKGKYATGNNRVLDLLKDLNLNDRIKTSDNTFEEIIDSNIDWEKVSILKNKMRTVSIEYLNKNL